MNKRIVRIFLMTLLGILFLNVADVYASGSSYSRARIYLKSGSPTAGGKVYVGKAATSSPSYKNCTSTTSAASSAEVEGANKTTTYHFYAQANAGYKFTGWYTKNNNDEYTLASTEAHYSVAVTSGAAPSGMDNSYTDKNLYASFVKIIQLSFVTPTNGSYTITHDGAAVSDYASFTVDGTVKLQAFPDAGYRLKGWYTTTNGGATKSYFAFGDECEPNFTANTTIGAEFEPDDGKAQFWVQGTNYVTSNLAAANTKAESSSSKKIIVVNSGSIPTGTFTISSGVTLLIPYGSDYSKITEPNKVHITGIGSAPELKVYKKLTLAPGAIIDCSGSICVGGQVMAINGGNPTSLVRGSVGVLDLSLGGRVNLKSGSKLYAWGFVQGQNMNQGNNTSNVGEIIAESGSNVYEVFQCGEWRGGTASQTIYNNRSSWKFFPFQSYTIQNIEAPITLKNGAKETCYWTIYGNGQTYTVEPDLIGSSGLFVLGTGASLKKWYDPTTDRVCYAMSGSASLGAISITLSGMTISSGDYNLPIPANMHIIVNSGTTTIGNPMVMHAGSVVEIKSDATLQLNSNCYMFDQTDWSTYCMYAYYFRNYANLTAHYDRDATYAGWNYSDGKVKTLLEDARLVVDGTLKFGSSGRLYSSTSGSAVVGNGGGQVQFGTLPGTTTIVMCKELSNNTSVSVSNANLCNDDGSYTKAIASTTFKNVNGRWFTSAASIIKSNKTYDFTYIKSGAVYGTGGTNTTVAAVYSHDKTGILDRMKWANVKADVCDNWWAGLNDTYLYNWTLHSAWHQFQPTGATIGEGDEVASIYSGSDNKLYTKLDCDIEEYGGTDANCLYTVGGVQKAFVNGALVALVKNTNDEAYHKSNAATTYYICFSEGCNWHPATKVASTNKAYTVDGQDYIWYDGAWLAATKDGTFYYSLDEHNIRIYYEYVSDAWTLASPVAETTRSGNTLSWFKIADAFSDANTGTGPGTATTIKLLKNVSVSTALNYTGNGNTILDLNGYTLTGTVPSMITLNAANAVLIVIDQSAEGTGKIQLSYSANSRRYAVSVTKGHFILNSGTVSAINTKTYNSSSANTTDVGGVTVASGHKFTMNGGTLKAVSQGASWGVNTKSTTTSVVTINGGTIEAESTSTTGTTRSASSIYSLGGTIHINGGTLTATADSVARCVNVVENTNTTLTIAGGNISAKAKINAAGVYVTTASTIHINGGNITATGTTGLAYGVYSYGKTDINGGTIKSKADISAFGVVNRGQMVINSTDTIHAEATTQYAYGINTNEAASKLWVNNGVINVTTARDAYGLNASHGTDTINGGEFIVQATGSSRHAYGIYMAATNPKCVVNGGKFKVTAPTAANAHINTIVSGGAVTQLSLAGGYYSKEPHTSAELASGSCIAAGKTVKDLDAEVEASLISAGYGCKVAGKEYTVTWCKMGGNTDSNILKTEKWESGKVPVWTDPDPNLNTTGVTRIFTGWNTGTWNSGTAYPLGTPLPAITDHNVTYYARNTPIYAEVIAGSEDSLFTSAQSAWKYAMKKTQATIRIKTQLGTEASVGNMTQMVFNPDNANSTITLDLNGLSWTMGNHATASNNKDVFLSVAPEKENCKLIITDNSASGNGYLMNSWAKTDGDLRCVEVNAGELVLQKGGIKVKNTDADHYSYGVVVSGDNAHFTMTGGTVYATDGKSPRGVNVANGYGDIAGGTVEAKSTAGEAYALLCYDTVNVSADAVIKATGTAGSAYGLYCNGASAILTVDSCTVESKGTNWVHGVYAISGGKIVIDGNPTVSSTATTGSGAYGVYSTGTNSNITVNSGTFTVKAATSAARGLYTESSGAITVKDGSFTVTSELDGDPSSFGAYTEGGTINIEGGNFTLNVVKANQNADLVRCGPYATAYLNVSGGTFTSEKAFYGVRSFGGETTVTGNPVFTAHRGIGAGEWASATGTAKVTIDGGTYNCTVGYALLSKTHTNGDYVVTGDVTVWDGKFYSGTSEPVSTGSGTSYLKIRGGYYSTYTTDNVSNLTKYVVSPSTTEKKDTTIDGKDYTYRVNTKYTVTWSVNGNTTTQQYNRNETPSYGSTPAISDGNTYEFLGWSPEIAPVNADVTYTAQFKKWEAEVYEGESATGVRFEHFTDAWDAAQNLPVAKIKMLSDVNLSTQIILSPDSVAGSRPLTLDLNNHTLAYTGTEDRFLYTNKAGCKLIITDNSATKNGVIKYDGSRSAGQIICAATHYGDLELQGGTIYARNTYSGKEAWGVYPCLATTFTMTDGAVQAYAPSYPRAVYTESSSTAIVDISGGSVLASTEVGGAWGNNAYGIYATSGSKFTISGTAAITAHANQDAYAVYATGVSGNMSEVTIKGGSVNAIVETSRVFGAYAAGYGKINIEGGTVDGHSNVAVTTSMWNVEGAHCAGNGELNISGGNITSSNGASPIGVSVHGGTTTITGGTINSEVAMHVVDYAAATQTAIVNVFGGTFIGNKYEAVKVAGRIKDGRKNNANVTINGGYFFNNTSPGNYITLQNETGAEPSTLVLNGGYYNKWGDGRKEAITALKGDATTVTDINETVDGRKYDYKLSTPFAIHWRGGTSYSKDENILNGVVPSNDELVDKAFIRNDSTFYFTGWNPTPTYVTGETTYQAEGDYYEAEVKIGSGAWTRYADFLEAWAVVQENANCTIRLLSNLTLADKILYKPEVANARTTFDLNNFTLSVGGTVDRLLEFSKNDAILTITDNSTAKGGTLSIIRTSTGNVYTTCVHNGELKMTGGRLYVENNQNDANWHPAIAVYVAASDNAKLTMTGGTLESKAKYCAYTVQSYGITNITGGTVKANSPGLDDGSNGYAIGIYAVQRTTTIGDTAKIEATGLMSINGAMATGWISTDGQTRYNGTLNITGGTIDVTATAKNACGVQANATSKTVDGTNYGAHGIVNISGGTFNVKCSAATATQVFAMQVTAARIFDTATPHNLLLDEKAEANISGGTFLVDTRNSGAWVVNGGNVDLLRNWGTLNVSGGNFTIYQRSNPVGVAAYRDKATISGNPVFNINSYVTATGVEAGPWNSNGYCDADASNNLAEIEVNGGTFNVKTESDLSIGAWSRGGLDGDSKYAMNAKVTVNGGEFVCINPTAGYSRIFRQENTRTGTYGSATAQIIVRGGKFKPLFGTAEPYSSTGTHNVTLPDNNDKRTVLAGGYYVHNTELATFVADTCVITPITSAAVDAEYNNGYRYRIDVNYVAKVQTGSTTKNYTTVKAAFDYAKTVSNPTITLLDNCTLSDGNYTFDANSWTGTLDLNNFTLTPTFDSSLGRAFTVKGTGSKLTITDNSSAKGGKIYYQGSSTMTVIYIVVEGSAEVELAGGTLYAENTSTDKQMNGFVVNGSGTKFTQSDGTFIVKGKYYGRGYYGSGTVELKGGKMNVTGETSQAIGLNPNTETSVLNISGTFALNAKSDNYAYGVYTQNGTATIEENPNLYVEAPTRARVLQGTGGSTTVNGGLFEANGTTASQSDCYALISEGTSTMTVGGGKFKTNQNNIAYKSTDATLTINGGYFNESSGTNHKTQVTNYKGSGKEVMTLDSDEAEYIAGYRYLVTSDPVAKVKAGSSVTYYPTVAAAFTAANATTDTSTITMLKDATATSYLHYTGAQNCTLDLNGHTITSTTNEQSPLHINNTNVTFTITDGTEEKSGKLLMNTSSSSAIFGAFVDKGTLLLNAGTIEVTSSTANTCGVTTNSNGTFTMNGGTIHVKATNSSKEGRGVYSVGSATINDGTVHVEAAGAGYGIKRDGGTVTVNDGKFNISGSTANVTNQDNNSYVKIYGGYYNIDTKLATCVAAPYHVFGLTSGAEYDEGYHYEVAEGYTLTWNLGGGTVTAAGTAAAVDATGTPNGYVKAGASITAPTVTRTGYTFSAWSPAVAATMPAANTTYTATWTVNSYTIRFLNYDSSVLQSSSVNYGEKPVYSGETPSKLADATYTYTFSGWSPAIGTVTGAQDYTAQFRQTENVASVTDNSSGKTVYYTEFSKAFAQVKEVTFPVTITLLKDASCSEALVYNGSNTDCTLDLNGHTLTSTSPIVALNIYQAGTTFTITDKTKSKSGQIRIVSTRTDEAYGVYVYKGHLKLEAGTIYASLAAATCAGVRAVTEYSSFTMGDGGTIHLVTTGTNNGIGVTASNGTTIINGGTIHVETTSGDGYGIKRDGGTVTVNGGKFNISASGSTYVTNQASANANVVIKGGYYTTNSRLNPTAPYHVFGLDNQSPYLYEVAEGYTLTWTTNGNPLTGTYTSGVTKPGTTIVQPATPIKTGYTFSAWSPAVAATMPAEDTEYTATWTPNTNTAYTVTHYQQNIDDDEYTLIDTDNLTGTTDAATEAVAKSYTGFTAQSFSQSTIAPDGSTTVSIYYNRDKFTITWNNADGTTLETDANVKYGALPVYDGTTPTKATDAEYAYTFDTWSPTVSAVTGDAVYTATYTTTPVVASVTANSTTAYYTSFADAWTAANSATAASTLTLLQDISGLSSSRTYSASHDLTLDLNGHTLSGSGSITSLFQISCTGYTFTITDGSANHDGKLSFSSGSGSTSHCVIVTNGTFVLEAGTIEATSSTTSIGAVQVTGGTFTMNENGAVHAKYTGNANGKNSRFVNATGGTTNINGGTIHLESPSNVTDVIGFVYSNGTVTITGGRFNLEAGRTAAVTNQTKAINSLNIRGGYYSANTTTYFEPHVKTPYHIFSNSDATYIYRVAEAYTLTWSTDGDALTGTYTSGLVEPGAAITAPATPTKAGYTFAGWSTTPAATMPANDVTYTATWTMDVVGDRLDIVDWTATDLTINANGWAAAGWPYTINGTSYGKESRAADRTLTIPYSGEAGTDLRITVESGGSIIRQHYYRIPFIGTAAGVTSADTIYVNSGTLAIDASSLSEVGGLYICPGASVNITEGMLSIGKLVLRTLPWQSGAISGSFTATETWYTRIAPNNRTITGPYAPITYAPSNYYQFGLPLGVSVKVKDIQVSNGEKITYGKAWLVKRYDEAMRAASGFGDNWVALDENESIQGGAGYEMSSNSPYYREYYFPVGAVSSSSLGTSTEVAYHLAAAGEKHAGWNVVTSPLMGVYDNTKANPESGMKVSWLMTDGSYDQGIPEYIYPAVPFSYQTEKAGSVSFSGTSLAVLAPRRRVAAEEEQERIQWIHLDVKDADGIGDHTSVLAHPTRYDETYQTGIDVAKQSFEASRALLYTVHAYGDMAFAGVADSLLERGIPVTVYSPAGQELTFSLRENDWLDRLAEVWLIDNETGTRTDLLRDDYSFLSKAGTTAGRFVIMGRFFAPGVATGIMDAQGGDAQGAKAQKVLVDDKMYILINGRTYDATGKLVTNDNNK